ncbi:MAG: hypothetical protein ABW176_17005, partial [Candidatus Thiodiazotropha endolucinida]
AGLSVSSYPTPVPPVLQFASPDISNATNKKLFFLLLQLFKLDLKDTHDIFSLNPATVATGTLHA